MEVFRAGSLLLQNLNSNYKLLICKRRNHVYPSATLGLVFYLPSFYQVPVDYYHIICVTRSTSSMPLLYPFVCIILKIAFITSIIFDIRYLTLWSKINLTVAYSFLTMFPSIQTIPFFEDFHASPDRPCDKRWRSVRIVGERIFTGKKPKCSDNDLFQCYYVHHKSGSSSDSTSTWEAAD